MTAQPESNTRLRGARLAIARTLWVVIVALTLVVWVALIPIYFREREFLSDWQVRESAPALGLVPFSPEYSTYATYTLVLRYAAVFVFLVTAFVIFWRKSNDWMALFVSLTLVVLGVTLYGGYTESWSQYPRPWDLFFKAAREYLGLAAPLCLLMFAYLFPNGRFVPHWMRWVAIASVALGIPIFLFLPSISPDRAWWVGMLTMILSFALGVLAQIYRYRRVSDSVQCQQTRWVVFGLSASLVGLLTSMILYSLGATPLATLLNIHLGVFIITLIPLTIGISILRYRLWDIDLLIRRTLVYSILTALLALVYFGCVVVLQAVFAAVGGQRSEPVTILSTLTIAALFAPLRRRVQNVIDRRFYRRKYDAAKTLAAFAATVRDETDLDRLTERLMEVVEETMQPAHVSLWLKEFNAKTPRRRDARL